MLATALVAISLFWFWTRPASVAFSLDRFKTENFTFPDVPQDEFPNGLSMRYAVLNLTNTSPYTIWYNGVSGRPNCTISQQLRSLDLQLQGCNTITPSRWVALPPDQTVTFSSQFDDDCKTLRFMVKLKAALFGATEEQWSEPYVVPYEQVIYPRPHTRIYVHQNDTDKVITA